MLIYRLSDFWGPPGENVPTKNVMRVNAHHSHVDHVALKWIFKKSILGLQKRISDLRNLRQLLLLDGDVFCEQFKMREMKIFGVENDFY